MDAIIDQFGYIMLFQEQKSAGVKNVFFFLNSLTLLCLQPLLLSEI